MNSKRPTTIEEYKNWLKNGYGVELTKKDLTYYQTVAESIRSEIKKTQFWIDLTSNLHEFNDDYYLDTGYHLFKNFEPIILIKPFDSFILKTFRKNILENKNWPEAPQDGWLLPENWFSRINDVVRTLLEVKYLDGVQFTIDKITIIAMDNKIACKTYLEAREEGYYAAHLYTMHNIEIPKITWDTKRIDLYFEIQITTQLQEVIRKLLHKYYENVRVKSKKDEKWKWDYKSDEFATSYLGHILHYLEGMIIEVRDKQREKEKIP